MKERKNILTEKEMELVSLLMSDCKNTGDIVAESLDGTFTEWKVYNENLMPYGLKIYDILITG